MTEDMARLALGLDQSTQSITAVVVDIDARKVVYEKSLDNRADPRLSRFGLTEDYILPPAEEGEANQPVAMYFVAIDALFSDMKREFPERGLNLSDIAVINVSGQQHGHGLFNKNAGQYFDKLKRPCSDDADILSILEGSLAVPFARIWKTSHTGALTEEVREAVGGKEEIIRITGSNAPWRFSAFGIMKTGRDFPEEYGDTLIIHQISSIVPAVLVGSLDIPLDYGNACGTSLMDYVKKEWSAELIRATAKGLPGGEAGLRAKLPRLSSGTTLAGKIAEYFVQKYGFSPQCAVGIGSGDNPQTKVLVAGSMLSLGSGHVNMVETDGLTLDMRGYTNAMYDALDRPFMFGCRTNGALSWDRVRAEHGFSKHDYEPAEEALKKTPPGNGGRIFLWHPSNESFPVSSAFGPVRIGYNEPDFAADYAGVIEGSLASIYVNSKYFMASRGTLYVAGGSTSSQEIMRRIAAIWNTTVVPIEGSGAALGAAVSGGYALLLSEGLQIDPGEFGPSFLKMKQPIQPRAEDVAVYHGDGGFLEKYEQAEAQLIAENPA
ncbi:MAG: xylulose kinase [Planctomycetia bacterium]|nr:xylulose kinase [Planctomycetia bacterium]